MLRNARASCPAQRRSKTVRVGSERRSAPDPNALRIRTDLYGTLVQDWTTEDMIFDVRALIAYLSAGTTPVTPASRHGV